MILNGTRPANHHRLPAAGDCADQPRNREFERHRISQVRVGGETFGRQAGIPAGSRVLPHSRGHDRDRAPVTGRDQAVMAAAGQALQRGRADLGTIEGGRQLRSHLASSGMLASHQRASALDGGPVQILDNQHQGALLTRR
jgi:hypothetical protein